MRRGRYLPEGLVQGCTLKRDIPKDAVLTYDDVVLPAGRLVAERHVETVRTPYGEVRLKVKHLGERRIQLVFRQPLLLQLHQVHQSPLEVQIVRDDLLVAARECSSIEQLVRDADEPSASCTRAARSERSLVVAQGACRRAHRLEDHPEQPLSEEGLPECEPVAAQHQQAAPDAHRNREPDQGQDTWRQAEPRAVGQEPGEPGGDQE